jgi:hypothetical protein
MDEIVYSHDRRDADGRYFSPDRRRAAGQIRQASIYGLRAAFLRRSNVYKRIFVPTDPLVAVGRSGGND